VHGRLRAALPLEMDQLRGHVLGNLAMLSDGGGIANLDMSTVKVRGGSFVNNNVAAGNGGGIANFDSAAEVTASTIDLNRAEGWGGGVFNDGWSGEEPASVHVVGSRVSRNRARAGGGLANHRTAVIRTSTFDGNAATAGSGLGGGAVFNAASGHGDASLTATYSTFSRNLSSAAGGGVRNGVTVFHGEAPPSFLLGEVSLANVTFWRNKAATSGGAILNALGFVEVNNATIASNVAASGGGIAGGATATNTILASNGENCSEPLGGAHILAFPAGSCGPGVLIVEDPLLGPLATNGGPTWTLALAEDSPAIGKGDDDTCLVSDQRGLGRFEECDIGAYEYGGVEIGPYPLPDDEDG
jgi:hypothetical protein